MATERRPADSGTELPSVEDPEQDSDEDPLKDPFMSVPPRMQRGRLGWPARAAILGLSGMAATMAVVGLGRGRPRPAAAQPRATEFLVERPVEPACLCLFDVDRTLTGKQRLVDKCEGNAVISGVFDTAFGGGDLTLSALGQGVKSTFCGGCHRGVVSAGPASGPGEQAVLAQHLADDPNEEAHWSLAGNIRSQYVINCPNPQKAMCAKGILKWFGETKGIWIEPEEVYFFDDLTGNTASFAAEGMNARQVSCASRDGDIGVCGAQTSEIVRTKGIKNC